MRRVILQADHQSSGFGVAVGGQGAQIVRTVPALLVAGMGVADQEQHRSLSNFSKDHDLAAVSQMQSTIRPLVAA